MPRLRAQRHPDTDLTPASRDRVGLNPVDADDREGEREPTEDREERRARPNEPQLDVALEMLREGFERKNRQHRIDFTDCPPNEIGHGRFVFAAERGELDDEKDFALETAREWQIKRAAGLLLEDRFARGGHDANDFDRFVRLDLPAGVVVDD